MNPINLLTAATLGFAYFALAFTVRLIVCDYIERQGQKNGLWPAVVGFFYFVVLTAAYTASPFVVLGLLAWSVFSSFSIPTLIGAVASAIVFMAMLRVLSNAHTAIVDALRDVPSDEDRSRDSMEGVEARQPVHCHFR